MIHNRNSIQSKLNTFMITMILTLIITGCVIAISIFYSVYEDEVSKDVNTGIFEFQEIVLLHNEGYLRSYTKGIEELFHEYHFTNQDEISPLLKSYMRNTHNQNIEMVRFTFEEEQIIALLSCDESVQALADRQFDTTVDETKVWVDGSDELGLYMFCRRQLFDQVGDAIGAIDVCMQLDNQDTVEFLKNTSDLEATIFAGDKRLVTTIVENGTNLGGTRLDKDIAEVLLNQGKTYFGEATVLESKYKVAYIPVFNPDHKPVGILFVGKSLASMNLIRNHIVASIMVLGAVLLLISYLVSNRWLYIHITEPMIWTVEKMRKIAEGSFPNLQDLPNAKSDEVEMLQHNMKVMVDEISSSKKKLEQEAYFDRVTGLPNRTMLYERYGSITLIENPHALSVLFYIDMDNLKYINNLFGHRIGDELLKQVGLRLEEVIKQWPSYMAYRVSGDEFVLCKEGYFNENEIIELSELLIQIIVPSFLVEQQHVNISASIGVSSSNYCDGSFCELCTGRCKDDLDLLLKKAEAAMNQVKANGKNGYLIFTPSMNEALRTKARLQQDLVKALRNGDLELYYQPKFSLSDEKYIGVEALVRWNHPEKGIISPTEFIPIAEESNLIHEIGAWILEEACCFIKEYNDTSQKVYSVAVNVSAIQILSDVFLDDVNHALEKSGLDPSLLELELTESVFIHSLDNVYDTLNLLRSKNISIALDDFGTGYSSLTVLKRLPITTLKLDKTFIDDILEEPVSREILDSVMKIGKSVGLKIVVEGIETEDQYRLIINMACDVIQGYYFSPPMPASLIPIVLEQK